MYDVPLSFSWLFDRCLELQPYYVTVLVFAVVIAGLVATALIFITKKRLNVSLNSKRLIVSIPIIIANLAFAFLFIKSLFTDGLSVFGLGHLGVILVFVLSNVIWYFLMKLNFPFTKKLKKDTVRTKIVSFLLATVALAPTTALVTVIVGFITCIEVSFIAPLDAAHPIHAIIKERFKARKDMPKTLDDLREINPEKFKLLSERAKLTYIFDEEKNDYTFFVRPSLHYVAVFDNTKDIVIYKLDNGSYYYDSDQTLLFPPVYPGPWDQLPK